jgi:hypothetical protein
MKSYWLLMFVLMVLSGCSRGPTLNLDAEVWSGKATRVGNPDTFVRLTFTQTGEAVEGRLETGQSATTLNPDQTLTGSLQGSSLSLSGGDVGLTGTLTTDTTFLGTLSFISGTEQTDFLLELTRQNAP